MPSLSPSYAPLPSSFNDRLNQIPDEHKFDVKVERLCHKFCRKSPCGLPSLAPGVCFRALLIGYFEGLDSQRGIAWRTVDSPSSRMFPGYALDQATPDHSTISRTRRMYWLETHKAIFRWVLKILDEEGLVSGRTVSIDATTLEANAALKSIVRRDNGQSYNDYLKELACISHTAPICVARALTPAGPRLLSALVLACNRVSKASAGRSADAAGTSARAT